MQITSSIKTVNFSLNEDIEFPLSVGDDVTTKKGLVYQQCHIFGFTLVSDQNGWEPNVLPIDDDFKIIEPQQIVGINKLVKDGYGNFVEL